MKITKEDVHSYFIEKFGDKVGNVYASPGRINLIGEHTDFFIQHGFARVVKMILAMYAPYFTAAPCEEWTLEAEKDQVEQNMLRLCDWLKKQGEDIGDWKEYEQVYITC